MNDNEIETGLRDYYQSIAPADSNHATRLVATSLWARRRQPGAARGRAARPLALIRIAAAAAIVALVSGLGVATWRGGSHRDQEGGAQRSAGASPSAYVAVPSARASATSAALPTPTLRAATSSTPSGSFSLTGAMNGQYDTATRLLDGRVLMTGNYTLQTLGQDTSHVYTTAAELYDPETGTFSPTGSMVQACGGATATLLADGRVLIAGGENDGASSLQIFDTAELYDPSTGRFSSTGSMGGARTRHTATLLDDGEVLIAGGQGMSGLLSTAELYSPKTGKFRQTGALTTGRSQARAMLLNDGRVLVFGDPFHMVADGAETYSPATGEFVKMPWIEPSFGYTATLLHDGRILIAGGTVSGTVGTAARAELYDPTTGTSTPIGSMTTARTGHTATLLSDGRVLIVGGTITGGDGDVGPRVADAGQPAPRSGGRALTDARHTDTRGTGTVGPEILGMVGSGTNLTSAEIYDPATGKFTRTGSEDVYRGAPTVTLLFDGRVLLTGGDANGTSAVLYQP